MTIGGEGGLRDEPGIGGGAGDVLCQARATPERLEATIAQGARCSSARTTWTAGRSRRRSPAPVSRCRTASRSRSTSGRGSGSTSRTSASGELLRVLPARLPEGSRFGFNLHHETRRAWIVVDEEVDAERLVEEVLAGRPDGASVAGQ